MINVGYYTIYDMDPMCCNGAFFGGLVCLKPSYVPGKGKESHVAVALCCNVWMLFFLLNAGTC